MVFTLENVMNLCIFTHAQNSHLNFQVQLLKQDEHLFPPRAKNKGVEETMIYFIKTQSENMKMTWYISLFVFCMVYNFSKCDGFTVL